MGMVLRSAIKTRDQTQKCVDRVLKRVNTHVYASSTQAEDIDIVANAK